MLWLIDNHKPLMYYGPIIMELPRWKDDPRLYSKLRNRRGHEKAKSLATNETEFECCGIAWKTLQAFSVHRKGEHGIAGKSRTLEAKSLAAKLHRKRHYDKVVAREREWKRQNYIYDQTRREYSARCSTNLTDNYIKMLLHNQYGLPFSAINNDLVLIKRSTIESKRLLLKVKRMMK